MAYTEAQLRANITALETALTRGERSVSFADRNVVYRTVEEIREAIAYFQGLLDQLLGRPRQFLGVATKGF